MSKFFGVWKDTTPLYTAGNEARKEYFSSGTTVKRTPRIRIALSPWGAPFVPIEFLSADYGGLIQTFQWDKSRHNAYGRAVFTLAGDDAVASAQGSLWPMSKVLSYFGGSISRLFSPMTLAQIWINGYHCATGCIRQCRRVADTESASVVYQVVFDELGFLYCQSVNSNNLIRVGKNLNFTSSPTKLADIAGLQFGLPLDQAITVSANAFAAQTFAFGFRDLPFSWMQASDGLPVYFRLLALPAPFGGIGRKTVISTMLADAYAFSNLEGTSYFDYLKSIINMEYMELYCESGGRTIVTGNLFTALAGTGASTSVGASGAAASGGIGAGAGGAAGTGGIGNIGGSGAAGAGGNLATGTGTAGSSSFVSSLSGAPAINASALLPGFCYLVLRTLPYSNPILGFTSWVTLWPFLLSMLDLVMGGDFVIVTDRDVIKKDLGSSDYDQKTVFEALYNGRAAAGNQHSAFRPSIAHGPLFGLLPGGIRTYGTRYKGANVNATSLQNYGIVGQSLEDLYKVVGIIPGTTGSWPMSTLMAEWHRNEANFKSGTIVTRGMPYARPGMALLFLGPADNKQAENPEELGLYYIDNLSYQYTIGKPDYTVFNVIRGTPLPSTASQLAAFLYKWDVTPVLPNIVDFTA